MTAALISFMITNFPSKPAYNQGGYRSFLFVPINSVLAMPLFINSVAQGPVTLYTGYAWLTGYATGSTLSYDEQPTLNENGTFYDCVVTGSVPGDKPELVDLMASMPASRYLVLIRDPAGLQRLVGTPAAPLDFGAAFASGAARADQRGFTFKFSGQQLGRAPYYNY